MAVGLGNVIVGLPQNAAHLGVILTRWMRFCGSLFCPLIRREGVVKLETESHRWCERYRTVRTVFCTGQGKCPWPPGIPFRSNCCWNILPCGFLPPERQGEALHRYVLGLYDLMERLTGAFPDVLFEGCSGGGGRFDAAMLAYSPQIWCSDDSDAIERLSIQYGTSFGYPVSTVGAHVSACPNHQTGRSTPMGTRGVVAMAGTFGYELDPAKLSEAEKEQVREQIQRFDEYYDLIQNGDYYRLGHWQDNGYYTAWQMVSPNREETLVSVVMARPRVNLGPVCVKLKGLDPDSVYETARMEVFGSPTPPDAGTGPRRNFTGAALMYGGYLLPFLYGEYPSVQIWLRKTTPST